MAKGDYTELKFGLENLAINDRIPIEHYEVLKNCRTNEEGDVLMDVSTYTEDAVQAIMEHIELEVIRQDEDTLLIEGDFGGDPDRAPY